MKKTRLMTAMAVVIGGAVMASAAAHAQTTPIEVWQPSQQAEQDPAKRVAPLPQQSPDMVSQSVEPVQAYSDAAPVYVSREQSHSGGFFIGVQAGKGWVYDDVDQPALMVNAGYRWQAGDVTLVGLEVAAGQLDDTDHDGEPYEGLDFGSVGANARFNFGNTSPVYGLVRGGYWRADNALYGGSIDGAYVGVGLGVDFTRNFNMSVTYTNHVYFTDYSYTDDGLTYDLNRADTLMLGAEVRF